MTPKTQEAGRVLDLARAATAAGLLFAICFVGLVVWELLRPTVLLLGNVTIDVVDSQEGGVRPGGSITYAAVALRALGIRACVVTAAGPDADLSAFEGHDLTVVPSDATLTFEHTHSVWWAYARQLRVTAAPAVALGLRHVPRRCRRARAVLLGPLTLTDVDTAGVVAPPQGLLQRMERGPQVVGLIAQGLQRRLDAEGRVLALSTPSQQLLASLGPSVSVFLSDVETDPWAPGAVQQLADQAQRVVVTQGSKGATEYIPGGRPPRHIPITHVPRVLNTNGAGDSFAAGFMAALLRGAGSGGGGRMEPGAAASWAASRAVSVPQSCKPFCCGDAIRQDADVARLLRPGPWDRLAAAVAGARWQVQQLARALLHAVHQMRAAAGVAAGQAAGSRRKQ